MSLSFVSKTVQTSTGDGGYEETAIEGNTDDTTSRGPAKPLFEQLRSNQEEAQSAQQEYQKALMRGTLALDEEDADHLERLRQQKDEAEAQKQASTNMEVAAFWAAKAEREEQQQQHQSIDLKHATEKRKAKPASNNLFAPKIVAKRRRNVEPPINADGASNLQPPMISIPPDAGKAAKQENEKEVSLGGLLAGYDSSSDEE